ncbi:hypothetical protein BaRGS_00020650 [Batillaria attramentaria]|uniref:Uncharacterized protein n=1 Tax=Batillaria attramentaria TaxID=370345 RepID=A0ABD0KLS9_9CAEN
MIIIFNQPPQPLLTGRSRSHNAVTQQPLHSGRDAKQARKPLHYFTGGKFCAKNSRGFTASTDLFMYEVSAMGVSIGGVRVRTYQLGACVNTHVDVTAAAEVSSAFRT